VRGACRLRGLRCIHTHLADEGLTRDDLNDLVLLRLDAMVSLAADATGLPGLAHVAALRATYDREEPIQHLDPAPPARLEFDFRDWIRALEEELARQDRTREVAEGERAILVSVTAGRCEEDVAMQVDELKDLAWSAGVEVAQEVTQNRPRPDPKFLIGSGKLQELNILAFQHDIDLVIFDQNLTPTQARNLSERLDLRVIDRTQLILDIFAQHARTRDGKLQVRDRRPRTRRDQARGRPPAHAGPPPPPRARAREAGQAARSEAPPPRPTGRARALHRRLHQRGKEHAPPRPHEERRAHRGQDVRHPRPDVAPPALPT
jgi:GTP-binding protein HflX